MVRIPDLYALQEIDSELDTLQRSLTDLQAQLGDDESTQDAQQRIDDLTATLHSAQQEQRSADDDAEDGKAKVTIVEEKLYGGSVTAPKELNDLQKELELLQRQQADREERALSALGAVETAQSELHAVQQELADRRAGWQTEQARLATEITALEAKLDDVRGRRQAATRTIDAPTLTLYDRLRKMRGGRAVARVERGACLGCRISLPSHIFQRARSGMAVVQCTSCERILYVG